MWARLPAPAATHTTHCEQAAATAATCTVKHLKISDVADFAKVRAKCVHWGTTSLHLLLHCEARVLPSSCVQVRMALWAFCKRTEARPNCSHCSCTLPLLLLLPC